MHDAFPHSMMWGNASGLCDVHGDLQFGHRPKISSDQITFLPFFHISHSVKLRDIFLQRDLTKHFQGYRLKPKVIQLWNIFPTSFSFCGFATRSLIHWQFLTVKSLLNCLEVIRTKTKTKKQALLANSVWSKPNPLTLETNKWLWIFNKRGGSKESLFSCRIISLRAMPPCSRAERLCQFRVSQCVTMGMFVYNSQNISLIVLNSAGDFFVCLFFLKTCR